MVASEDRQHDVGGVAHDRPFKVRRLGHFGIDVRDTAGCLHFYRDLLGFAVSDLHNAVARIDPQLLLEVEEVDRTGYFLRYGSDHHSLVLFPLRAQEARGRRAPGGEVTANQISWQVGSLREVLGAINWFSETGTKIERTGRDMPGSNWHVYLNDPEGHRNELFYGMEQIGWQGQSKPRALHARGYTTTPESPQIAEAEEVGQAMAGGVELASGYRYEEKMGRSYDVDGILLARPFKVIGLGPVRLFVDDLDAARTFYEQRMGFSETEALRWRGHEGVVFRCGNAHHVSGLYSKAMRSELGLSTRSTTLSLGLRIATYEQLRSAVTFLKGHGVSVIDLPSELSPGIDYAVYALDPDGHAVELYFSMEQLGWSATPRDRSMRPVRPTAFSAWPERLEATSDMYIGETFFGPLG